MRSFRILSVLVASVSLASGAASEEDALMVENGKQVALEYTLKLDDGSTADSNVGKGPLVFVIGQGRVLPALEKQLLGMELNETKHFELEAEQGYGPVREGAFQAVEPSLIPEGSRQEGAMLIAQDAEGRRIPVRIHKVEDEQITLDYNHPLAGERLNFDVKILGIEEPP